MPAPAREAHGWPAAIRGQRRPGYLPPTLLAANVQLVLHNAGLAATVAVAFAAR